MKKLLSIVLIATTLFSCSTTNIYNVPPDAGMGGASGSATSSDVVSSSSSGSSSSSDSSSMASSSSGVGGSLTTSSEASAASSSGTGMCDPNAECVVHCQCSLNVCPKIVDCQGDKDKCVADCNAAWGADQNPNGINCRNTCTIYFKFCSCLTDCSCTCATPP